MSIGFADTDGQLAHREGSVWPPWYQAHTNATAQPMA